MAIIRKGEAHWSGSLTEGSGRVKGASGAVDAPYSVKSRTADGPGTNPEELIAAAHAGCYSMMLSALLSGAGKPPTSIDTVAAVHMELLNPGIKISKIVLTTKASVPGLTAAEFADVADNAKKNCPVSVALSAVPIELTATLVE